MAKNDLDTRSSSANMSEEWTAVYDPENPPSITIVQTIADHKGVDPTELDFRLFDYIDPEALDSVIESAEVKVTFSIDEYEIHVDSDVIKVK